MLKKWYVCYIRIDECQTQMLSDLVSCVKTNGEGDPSRDQNVTTSLWPGLEKSWQIGLGTMTAGPVFSMLTFAYYLQSQIL